MDERFRTEVDVHVKLYDSESDNPDSPVIEDVYADIGSEDSTLDDLADKGALPLNVVSKIRELGGRIVEAIVGLLVPPTPTEPPQTGEDSVFMEIASSALPFSHTGSATPPQSYTLPVSLPAGVTMKPGPYVCVVGGMVIGDANRHAVFVVGAKKADGTAAGRLSFGTEVPEGVTPPQPSYRNVPVESVPQGVVLEVRSGPANPFPDTNVRIEGLTVELFTAEAFEARQASA